MEVRHLKPYADRMVAAARALDQAIKSGDPMLVTEAHLAIGRVRERLAPQIALVVKHEQSVERFQKEKEAEKADEKARRAAR